MPNTNEYMANYMRERRLRRRADLINLAGGMCVRCGKTEDLNFDHRDPATRLFVLSGKALDKAWAKILEELAKCDLLCVPCHLDKTRENGDNTGGGRNRIDDHGTVAMYMKGCRCDLCAQARYDYRVARGEHPGTRGRYGVRV